MSDDTPRCDGHGNICSCGRPWQEPLVVVSKYQGPDCCDDTEAIKRKCDGCPDCRCEECKGTGEVEGQVRNAYFPDMMDDVPLVCNACKGRGRLVPTGA